MDLDHIFLFVEPDAPEFAQMAELGFAETYRRVHPGQGTENACYAFDNLFIELLWIRDADEARSEPIRRTGLYERSRWRKDGTCPFGIAWRGNATDIAVWDYRPPYLPADMSIAVACDGDDARRPMLFRSPGSAAPIDWPEERRGDLQQAAGFGAVSEAVLVLPEDVDAGPALGALQRETPLSVQRDGNSYRLDLTIERRDGGKAVLSLPDLSLR